MVVVTLLGQARADTAPYTIVRCPSAAQLSKWVAWSDVVFHNQVSLRLAWPLLLHRRPWVVTHHTWLWREGYSRAVAWFKAWVLRRATNIAVSRALAQGLDLEAEVIPNPYADQVFKVQGSPARQGQLIFVGRLVSDKGVALLLRALARLRDEGLVAPLCIVGQGPENETLQRLAQSLGLQAQVEFAGELRGAALASRLNQHRVAVVPSVWEEPFGLVALEAMACGCVPLVARSGGLPEAVGAAGLVFNKGDVADLCASLRRLLTDAPLLAQLRAAAPGHLRHHTQDGIAARYLQVLERAYGQGSAPWGAARV